MDLTDPRLTLGRIAYDLTFGQGIFRAGRGPDNLSDGSEERQDGTGRWNSEYLTVSGLPPRGDSASGLTRLGREKVNVGRLIPASSSSPEGGTFLCSSSSSPSIAGTNAENEDGSELDNTEDDELSSFISPTVGSSSSSRDDGQLLQERVIEAVDKRLREEREILVELLVKRMRSQIETIVTDAAERAVGEVIRNLVIDEETVEKTSLADKKDPGIDDLVNAEEEDEDEEAKRLLLLQINSPRMLRQSSHDRLKSREDLGEWEHIA